MGSARITGDNPVNTFHIITHVIERRFILGPEELVKRLRQRYSPAALRKMRVKRKEGARIPKDAALEKLELRVLVDLRGLET